MLRVNKKGVLLVTKTVGTLGGLAVLILITYSVFFRDGSRVDEFKTNLSEGVVYYLPYHVSDEDIENPYENNDFWMVKVISYKGDYVAYLDVYRNKKKSTTIRKFISDFKPVKNKRTKSKNID